jgi:hypothetical protein
MHHLVSLVGLVGGIVVAHGIGAPTAASQIIPDGALPINSQVVPGCTLCTIEGGTVRGVNLFRNYSAE